MIGADRQAYRDLMSPPGDRARDDTEETHGGEEQRAPRERADRHRARALRTQHVSDDLFHRLDVAHRDARLDLPQRRASLRE